MKMLTCPQVRTINGDDKIWSQEFDYFKTKIYVPANEYDDDVINYGYSAPYLLVFTDDDKSDEQVVDYSINTGLRAIASKYATSVVFVTTKEGSSFDNADEELYCELISNSKIHQYHKDGYAILNNRFTGKTDGYAIRGAIYRAYIFASGKAASYVAGNLLHEIEGDGLWGRADIVPTVCILSDFEGDLKIGRKDMPIVLINPDDDAESKASKHSDYVYVVKDNNSVYDYVKIFDLFASKYMRWGWKGELTQNVDIDEVGMIEEPVVTTVKTSADNEGDYKGSTEHELGYLAFYNKGLMNQGPVPLLLCFHGGGDSAKHIAYVSQWYKVAHDHNFLLICVEDHLNSTATEMMELLDQLSDKYNIDKSRIYATGFSMGGCKTWDLYQEYPEVFAALAPMDATFDVGLNVYGKESIKTINKDVTVPIYYVGGEETPLPELPFQEQKCVNRIKYVFEVNNVKKPYNISLNNKDEWENKIWGIDGDRVEKINDGSRGSVLTVQCYESADGNTYTMLGSVSGQGHECRYHSCENAWRFMEGFRRSNDRTLLKSNE